MVNYSYVFIFTIFPILIAIPRVWINILLCFFSLIPIWICSLLSFWVLSTVYNLRSMYVNDENLLFEFKTHSFIWCQCNNPMIFIRFVADFIYYDVQHVVTLSNIIMQSQKEEKKNISRSLLYKIAHSITIYWFHSVKINAHARMQIQLPFAFWFFFFFSRLNEMHKETKSVKKCYLSQLID